MKIDYELNHLHPHSFEHLINHLAIQVLGPGLTVFSEGADAGRDGYFQGRAPYPSEIDPWSGVWYIQSKFHEPSLSKDSQKWLLTKIKEEVKDFSDPEKKRVWPDIWIIATNINPSGMAETGTFDQAREIVGKANPDLKDRFHIWGGKKIVKLLTKYPHVADYYGHFLTPGNILSKIFNQIEDKYASEKSIIRHLTASQLDEQKYTKLEQAGSASDDRPGIHDIFIDLPFYNEEYAVSGKAIEWLLRAMSKCHRLDDSLPATEEWMYWNRHPSRAKLWFIKGGPGQGKSTIGQYICQIQRASLIFNRHVTYVSPKVKALATEIKKRAEINQCWMATPRIPVFIELKDYAHWQWQNKNTQATGILSYLSHILFQEIDQKVQIGTLKRMLSQSSWLFVFDGLDEVPQDLKDTIAKQVANFIENVAIESQSDLFSICTSRPQGYSGQFDDLNGAVINLVGLSKEDALACAEPILRTNRSQKESNASLRILRNAIESPTIKELMTTPLQAHIMAVVVRDGERPPGRKWLLFNNFYQVIKRRETNRELPDKKVANLLRNYDKLLKSVHNRLGFVLHARAESSKGAQARLERNEFNALVTRAVNQEIETNEEEIAETLQYATKTRLVLVNSNYSKSAGTGRIHRLILR